MIEDGSTLVSPFGKFHFMSSIPSSHYYFTSSIATDLNLHYPNTAKPKDERHAREMLNRTRAWLNCFNLDRSTGSQYGKAPIISNTDYVASRSEEWWNSSPYNMRGFDIQLAAYNAELKLVGVFRAKIHSDPNSPTGFNKVCLPYFLLCAPSYFWTHRCVCSNL